MLICPALFIKKMLIKTRGIIFKTIKYSETSIIADIYTEEKGLRKYIISGVRSKKAKISASLLQLMSLVDMVAYEREGRDLLRLKEIRPAYVYRSLPFDIRKGAVGIFMAEVARKAIRELEENKPLFIFLYDSFKLLDETTHPISSFHLQFLLELTTFLGFIPGGHYHERHPFFDLKEGTFVATIPMHPHYLDEKDSIHINMLLHSQLINSHQLNFTKEERRTLLKHLLEYYQLHIEGFAQINAHLVLQEVLE